MRCCERCIFHSMFHLYNLWFPCGVCTVRVRKLGEREVETGPDDAENRAILFIYYYNDYQCFKILLRNW